MKAKLFIRNIIIIAVIITAVFLSQKLYSGYEKSNNISQKFPLLKKGEAFSLKTGDWIRDNVYPKIDDIKDRMSGGLSEKKELLKSEIENQKKEIEKKSISTTKKFIAEKFLQTIGVSPQDLEQCQP